MNIRIMQNGGGLPPFTYYQPVVTNNAQARDVTTSASAYTSGGAQSANKDQISEKDLLSILSHLDGLPNDIDAISTQLQQFLRFKDSISGELMGIGDISSQYVRLLQEVKNAQFNKKEYDKTYNSLASKHALREKVILEDGSLLAEIDGKEVPITVEQYFQLKDKSNVHLLTNAEVLNIRAEDPKYKFSNGILNSVNAAVGMQDVQKYIQQFVNGLGRSETSRTWMESRQNRQIADGLEALQTIAENDGFNKDSKNLGGLFKVNKSTSDQRRQAAQALTFMYQTMPEQYKTLLKLNAGVNSDEKAVMLLKDFFDYHTSDKITESEDMELDATGKKPGTKGSSSGGSDEDTKNEPNIDLFTSISRGVAGTYSSGIRLMDKDGYSLQVAGTSYPNLNLEPSKPLKEGSLKDMMEYGYGSLTKGGDYAVTFGSQVLSDKDMDKVSFMNDQKSVRVILPITRDQLSGQIVPDLEFVSEHKDIIDLINKHNGNFNDPEIMKALSEAGIVNEYTGLPDTSRWQTYLCVNGLSTDRNIKNTDHVSEVKDDDLEAYVEIFERALYKDKEHNAGKEYKFDFDFSSAFPWDWGGLHDTLYQGTIYIPVTENDQQTKIGSGTGTKEHWGQTYEEDYQIGENARYAPTTSSNLLMN